MNLQDLLSAKNKLQKTDPNILEKRQQALTHKSEKEKAAAHEIRKIVGIENDDQRRDYFYNAVVEQWYENLETLTFKSYFVALTDPEKLEILIRYYERFEETMDLGQRSDYKLVIDVNLKEFDRQCDLSNLEKRIEEKMNAHSGDETGFFVKLSTRSPKDSVSVLEKAKEEFLKQAKTTDTQNEKWCKIADLVRLASKLNTGKDAINILIDSERVGEDMLSCLDGKIKPMSLVLRPFDDSITPDTEFRGFVWNGRFTCVGQYFFDLFYPGIVENKNQISEDLQRFYSEKIRDKLFPENGKNLESFGSKVPCFVMDLVWRGADKEPLLIEINPFDGEALCVFKGSTGLYDWSDIEGDRKVIMGACEENFTIRVREEEPSGAEVLLNRNPDWVDIVKMV